MLHTFFRRKQIADCRNHTDYIKNITKGAGGKKFTYQRKGNNFQIGKDNVKILVFLKRKKNDYIKNRTENIQYHKWKNSQKEEQKHIKGMNHKTHNQEHFIFLFGKIIKKLFSHK